MKRLWIAAVLTAASFNAHALGRLADVCIIDRDTGTVLATHYHQGEYWVAGTPGARYSIAIRNRLGERVMAVTAVDGVNVISGDTASWGQTGYVFGPGQSYQITGWRKSDSEVAAFEFTAAPASYAARTGRPVNVGVIGVALFRERPAVLAEEAPPRLNDFIGAAAARAGHASQDAQAAAAPPPAPSAAPMNRAANGATVALPSIDAKLGTGHGQREDSRVVQTDFVRQQNTPDELIRIRYDSLQNLIAMGVIPAPRLPWAPNPFPDSPVARYVPDPPQAR